MELPKKRFALINTLNIQGDSRDSNVVIGSRVSKLSRNLFPLDNCAKTYAHGNYLRIPFPRFLNKTFDFQHKSLVPLPIYIRLLSMPGKVIRIAFYRPSNLIGYVLKRLSFRRVNGKGDNKGYTRSG